MLIYDPSNSPVRQRIVAAASCAVLLTELILMSVGSHKQGVYNDFLSFNGARCYREKTLERFLGSSLATAFERDYNKKSRGNGFHCRPALTLPMLR